MLTFKTHNTANINTNMTCLRGHYKITKHKLVNLFGGPQYGGSKVTNQWELEVTDENGDSFIITIYDWKNYNMDELSDNYDNWYVGGNSKHAMALLTDLINQLSTEGEK